MKRIGLLVPALLLCAAMAAVVLLASPYAPVIGPVREIEDIWAIEDEREMSDAPLVTRLQNDGAPLAYDAASCTFYCTLGLDNGDEWPALHLTAPEAKGVTLCFTDDYAYDSCAEAIREGYEYEVMAYTDEAYDYFYIVFTGLPVVTIDAQAPIGDEDTDAAVTIVRCGSTPVDVPARVHLRGSGSRTNEKKSYHVDFVRGSGKKGVVVDVPLLGEQDDIILLAGVMDASLMRDRLSWTMYATISGENESYGARQVEYCEVFVDDAYAGVYLMMEPVDDAQELARSGREQPQTDSVYRSTQTLYRVSERPVIDNPVRGNSAYELRYGGAGAEPFAALSAYLALETEPDDGVFCEQAMRVIDLESILRYYLFVQAGGMSDNVYNNMYIWAHSTGRGVVYRFAPWDMDLTWRRARDAESGEMFDGLFSFGIAQRMIDLDAGSVTRSTLARLWKQMRSGAFTEENVSALVDGFARELNDSGAYARNTRRWDGASERAEGYDIVAFAGQHFATLDALFAGEEASE